MRRLAIGVTSSKVRPPITCSLPRADALGSAVSAPVLFPFFVCSIRPAYVVLSTTGWKLVGYRTVAGGGALTHYRL